MDRARARHAAARSTAVAAALIVLALGFGLAFAPSRAQAFSKAIWGEAFRNGVNQFPIYKRLGVKIFEQDLYWNQVAPVRPRDPANPNDPAYQWPTSIRQAITEARVFHMQVLLQIIGTPGWANHGRAWNWAPSKPSDFATFAAAASRHYPFVHLWMIWGEPTRAPNFQPTTAAKPGARLDAKQKRGPHVYAQMLNDAYGALKSVSKKNLVIGGCTYTTGSLDTEQWVQNLRLPNGRPPRMDMWAHNPFSFEAPSFHDPPSGDGAVQFSDLPELAGWLDRYIRKGLPIFLSEFTIPTQPDTEFNFYVDPTVAAQWVTDALRLSRHWHRIYALGWINVYDSPPQSYGGLMTVNGVKKLDFWAFANG
jgi:hypothetical protein